MTFNPDLPAGHGGVGPRKVCRGYPCRPGFITRGHAMNTTILAIDLGKHNSGLGWSESDTGSDMLVGTGGLAASG